MEMVDFGHRDITKIVDQLSLESIGTTTLSLQLFDQFSYGLFCINGPDGPFATAVKKDGKASVVKEKHLSSTDAPGSFIQLSSERLKGTHFKTDEIENSDDPYFRSSNSHPVEAYIQPLVNQGIPIGFLYLEADNFGLLSDEVQEQLRSISTYAATGVKNALIFKNLNEELESSQSEPNVQASANGTDKEEFVKALKELESIGQQVIMQTDTHKVIDAVYKNIHSLMDCSVLSIGIVDEVKGRIFFPYGMENGESLPYHEYPLSEKNRLAVSVYNSGEPIFTNNLPEEFSKIIPGESLPMPKIGTLPMSVIYLPIQDSTQDIIAVLTVQSFNQNAYTEEQLYLLKALTMYIGSSLERNNVSKKKKNITDTTALSTHKHDDNTLLEDLRLLNDIGQQITQTLDIKAVISQVYNTLNRVVSAESFGIGVANPIMKRIEFRGAIEKGSEIGDIFHPFNDMTRLSVICYKTKEVIYSNNFLEEYKRIAPNLNPEELEKAPQSLIYIPLSNKDKVIGVLAVISYHQSAYSEADFTIIKNIANYATVGIVNAQAYAQIELQKEEIEKTSDKIRSSIKYAKRIQSAVLPKRSAITDILPESFIFFKPRDIVSGDFFWLAEKYDRIFVAAVDCTGHGVPGAIMSMIGNNLLNEVVNILDMNSPDQILNAMHLKVRKLLKQKDSENRDGMDMSMVVIDRFRDRIEFAGAKLPLFIVKDGELEIIKGDRMPIGGKQREDDRVFTKHVLDIDPKAMYYLFSDGYPDQFGGTDNSKFMMWRFKEMLIRCGSMEIEDQRKELRNVLWDWMEKITMQTDDIMVIGFRPDKL